MADQQIQQVPQTSPQIVLDQNLLLPFAGFVTVLVAALKMWVDMRYKSALEERALISKRENLDISSQEKTLDILLSQYSDTMKRQEILLNTFITSALSKGQIQQEQFDEFTKVVHELALSIEHVKASNDALAKAHEHSATQAQQLRDDIARILITNMPTIQY